MKFSASPLLAGLALAGISSASSYISDSKSRSSKILPSRHVAGRRMSHSRSWSPKRQNPSAEYAPFGAPLGNTFSNGLAGLGGIVSGTPLGGLLGTAGGVVSSLPVGGVLGAAGSLSSGSPLGGVNPLGGVEQSIPLGLGGVVSSIPIFGAPSQGYSPGGTGAVMGMLGNPYANPNGQMTGLPLEQGSRAATSFPSWPLMGQVDNSGNTPNTLYGMASGAVPYAPFDGVPSTLGNIVPNFPVGGIINPGFPNAQGLAPVHNSPLEGAPSTWGGVLSQPGAQSTPFGSVVNGIFPLGNVAGTIPFGGVEQTVGRVIQNSGAGGIASNAPGPFGQIPHVVGQGTQYNYGYKGSSDPIQFDSSDDKKPSAPVRVAPVPIAAVNSHLPHQTLPVSPALPVSSPALPVSSSASPVPHPAKVGDGEVGVERVNGVTSALPVHIPGPVPAAASSVPKPPVVPAGLPTPPAVVPQLGPEHAPSSSSSSPTSATETVLSSASASPVSSTESTTATASTKPTTLSSRFFGAQNRIL
ncbi:hypothetical protein BS47DRAFT_1337922 [Hydnum rufescens UP504]|uniref:Uncharacterized protein n=1 Tax=Hydnum rufescens UP504 TaxID=1448309 RepID=A0A9P6E121_9AGAM|nr:hypothetical protein BS47DRAFT_1337922 [Hydnum rufescens UP504]